MADAKKPTTPAPAAPTGAFNLQAAIQSLQGLGGSGTVDYIGMPANAADPSAVIKADQGAQAQWAQGNPAAAYATGSQMLPVIQNWSSTDIATMQKRMSDSGLLANTDYQGGVWDDPSQRAFAEVLGMANNMGRPWQDAMSSYENGTAMIWDSKSNSYVKAAAGTARTKAPVITRFTNPDDLATAAQEVATAKIGRTFTPAELQHFVAAYHSTEGVVAANQAAVSGVTGGSYTDAPSAATAAETFAKQTDPTGFAGEQFLAMAQHLNGLLAGPNLATQKPMEA